MIGDADPLAPLEGLMLPPAAEEAIAALLISERLLAAGKALHIEHFALGPPHLGQRRVELTYSEPRRYAKRRVGGASHHWRPASGVNRWATPGVTSRVPSVSWSA
jgi:hypothetical protein